MRIAAAAFGLLSVTTSVGAEWKVSEGKSELGDKITTTARTQSEESPGAALVISCDGGKDPLVTVHADFVPRFQPIQGGRYGVDVAYQLDAEKVKLDTFIVFLEQRRVLIFPDSKKAANDLKVRQKLVLQVQAPGGPHTLHFDLKGRPPLPCLP